jgi:hypothetical protein
LTRIAKVITTCFKRGRVRENTELLGNPPGYFSHSQNFTTVTDTINLLNFQIDMEEKYTPGIKRDLIIVNSDVGSKEGNIFIEKLNDKKISNGKIISFTRKNVGLSYGAYSDAFLKFRDGYDFFLFIEDDLITAKKDYLKLGYEKWKQTANCGFIAYFGLSKINKSWWKRAGLNKSNAISAYGGCGLSSTIVLNKVVGRIGYLPHNTKNVDHEDSIILGEIGLSKSIIDLGYRLTEFKNEILVVPAYDLIRGIIYKKYPNIYQKYLWIFKSNIYYLISKSPVLEKYYLFFLRSIKNLIKFILRGGNK